MSKHTIIHFIVVKRKKWQNVPSVGKKKNHYNLTAKYDTFDYLMSLGKTEENVGFFKSCLKGKKES